MLIHLASRITESQYSDSNLVFDHMSRYCLNENPDRLANNNALLSPLEEPADKCECAGNDGENQEAASAEMATNAFGM